jgi:hypothetical protein
MAAAGKRFETIQQRAHTRLSKLAFKTELEVDPELEKPLQAAPSPKKKPGQIVHASENAKSSTSSTSTSTSTNVTEAALEVATVCEYDLISPDFHLNASSNFECVFEKESASPASKQIPDRRVLSILCPSKKFPAHLHVTESAKDVKNAVDDIQRMPRVLFVKSKQKVTKVKSPGDDGRPHATRSKITANALEIKDFSDDDEEEEVEHEKYLWETLTEKQKDLLLKTKLKG